MIVNNENDSLKSSHGEPTSASGMVANKLVLIFSAFTLVMFSVGCGASYSEYCEDRIGCQGGDEAAVANCVKEWEKAEQRAAIRDCQNIFEDYFDCRSENSQCKNGRWTHEGQCNDEDRAWQRC